MTQSPHLTLSELSYYYEPGAPAALDRVSLQIPRGQFLAVLGHNGSGKSTLAKLLNGLFLPTQGSVTVSGMDTRDDARIWDIRRTAGMVFQNPDNQLVATQVYDDVAFGLENIGIPPEEMPARIDRALEMTGMSQFKQHAPHLLSGGQKQRVAIAGILAMQPEALILDEATAMLDPQGRREVLDTVLRLNREQGITVVWITHFMEEAARAQRVLVMDHGRIAMDGTPGEIFSQVDRLRELRLDVPPMTRLAHLLQERGIPISSGVLTVDDMVEEVKRLCPSCLSS
ncbi:MAG TPA: energy-coupling factor transporter ATPase [Clostridia bacterium]|jgi:energy-coupling factor transport system ATP-binding protein|nr:energy-coupling factor transporter ATPase [Clostridia bacterium]HPY93794.1 energy-coupling factor transporter ATPase [Clostridia bacterium]HQA98034.1 energy-coupling factor transporter ATPase [Clostridia bacterium]HQO55115.1 energy-coupling factor transporter ATPase [Clostridia bacterium]HUM60733.1 energy-coupling factor transporter ATPase [Clostridia bacterium]